MKVFHIGITAPSYSSEAISKSFNDVFGECRYFDWQFHRFNYGTEIMRDNMLLEAKVYKPDVIFVHCNHNGEAIIDENYKQLSEIAQVVTYTEDVREDISHFENISPLVKLMIFTNIDDVEKLKEKGFNNAVYLPVSYNDIWYKKQGKTSKYYGDIVFVGNNTVNSNLNFPKAQERQDMIAALKKEFGDKFMAYGMGQENKMLNPQEAVECYNNAKIAIGHNNFSRKGYQSDRALNAMGCGCPVLMKEYDGIKDNFPDLRGFAWKNVDDLIVLCKIYFMENGIGLLDGLADYQYKEVTENHRWYNRAESIKELLSDNIL